ncbi:MspA family porin [Williamsia sterculiae]|uniref:MspA protein n=1 Tax=Williamsia sterculiae TaxID=1344003 RepID=A0A1N7DJY2_9NOCA|nr:MspA family porin [Williamsia sterculiae]SIR76152.1 MspA protein [Williamsia sterculiae]
MKKFNARSATVVAGAAGAAVITLAGLGAGNAAAFPVAGGKAVQKLADGSVVSLSLTNASVTLGNTIANNPASRHAWATGTYKVNVSGPAKGGEFTAAGFLVGCQLDFGSDGSTSQGGGTVGLDGTVTPSATTGAGFSLGPGKVSTQYIINNTNGDLSPDAGNYSDTTNAFKGNSGSITYSGEDVNRETCAGYASAKPFATVKVETDAVTGYVTVYGKPFSLG